MMEMVEKVDEEEMVDDIHKKTKYLRLSVTIEKHRKSLVFFFEFMCVGGWSY